MEVGISLVETVGAQVRNEVYKSARERDARKGPDPVGRVHKEKAYRWRAHQVRGGSCGDGWCRRTYADANQLGQVAHVECEPGCQEADRVRCQALVHEELTDLIHPDGHPMLVGKLEVFGAQPTDGSHEHSHNWLAIQAIQLDFSLSCVRCLREPRLYRPFGREMSIDGWVAWRRLSHLRHLGGGSCSGALKTARCAIAKHIRGPTGWHVQREATAVERLRG
eukprot:scaffold156539_cov26-Tisochrysis_lutea.AAC.9